MTRPRVLIVGAGGVFGSRLARLLARQGRFCLSLGGRYVPTDMPALSFLPWRRQFAASNGRLAVSGQQGIRQGAGGIAYFALHS